MLRDNHQGLGALIATLRCLRLTYEVCFSGLARGWESYGQGQCQLEVRWLAQARRHQRIETAPLHVRFAAKLQLRM
jgi:hypothetical protein